MHNIETHVVHHIFFTAIPHYNLVKATDSVKHMFGEYYLKDESSIPFAMFRSLKKCVYVPDEGQVLKYETCDISKLDELDWIFYFYFYYC